RQARVNRPVAQPRQTHTNAPVGDPLNAAAGRSSGVVGSRSGPHGAALPTPSGRLSRPNPGRASDPADEEDPGSTRVPRPASGPRPPERQAGHAVMGRDPRRISAE